MIWEDGVVLNEVDSKLKNEIVFNTIDGCVVFNYCDRFVTHSYSTCIKILTKTCKQDKGFSCLTKPKKTYSMIIF